MMNNLKKLNERIKAVVNGSEPDHLEKADLRSYRIGRLTQRLVILTSVVLLAVLYFFFDIFTESESGRSFMAVIIFSMGLGGGFVSIQQRLNKIGDSELKHLSRSWFPILLIPVYGGIFALVFHIAILSGIVEGDLFPAYHMPVFNVPPTIEDFQAFFVEIVPLTAADTAKMLFWAFIAGFSERLVPQIIHKAEGNLQAETATESSSAKDSP